MSSIIEKFKEKYPGAVVVDESYDDFIEDEFGDDQPVVVERYVVSKVLNLDRFEFELSSDSDFKRLDKISEASPKLFKDIFGGKIADTVEVVVSRVKSPRFFGERPSVLRATVSYKNNHLDVEILFGGLGKTSIGFLASKMTGVRHISNGAVAKISGISGSDIVDLENTSRTILRSVLFDIEAAYGKAFEIAGFESVKSSKILNVAKKAAIPDEPILLTYKPYISELIEYYHTADRVDHLPFKFICYFHIIEYFMDKSAHSVVAKKIKQMIMSPDFHARSGEYISEAIKVFRAETEKFMSDKVKVGRVLSEFLDKESIQKYLVSAGLDSYFSKEQIFKFNKDLKMPPLNFDSDSTFNDTLNRRIYAIRCSIVHSNPDFDETKAVPFSPTPHNLDLLRHEIALIKEVAKTIVVASAV